MDPRFSKVVSDPRFKQIKKNATKVTLDSRFKHVLSEKGDFGSKAAVDKYGRKKKQSTSDDLKRFYRMESDSVEKDAVEIPKSQEPSEATIESENEDNEPKTMENEADSGHESEHKDTTGSESESENESGSESEASHGLDSNKIGYLLARGDGLIESSDEEGFELDEEDSEDALITPFNEDIPRGAETKRLAVVNLDWDHVKAKDLFKLFEGFAPKKGGLLSVKVYPSEFGKERMALEMKQGPPSHIFSASEKSGKKVAKTLANPDESTDFDNKKLRLYQLERLRYYYAIVDCATLQTARAIYAACDNAEFETSSNVIDLRYIPAEMTFDDEPRDEAYEAPHVYEPKVFTTKALQHTKVDLTWDNDDPDRLLMTRRTFSKEEIEKMDMSAYVASSASEDSEEEVKLERREKYKKLLAEKSIEIENDSSESDSENESESGLESDSSSHSEITGNLESTFRPSLSSKAQDLLEKRRQKALEKSETVFETQMRLQKEKRKQRKMKDAKSEELVSDGLVSDHEMEEDDDFFVSEMQEFDRNEKKRMAGQESERLKGMAGKDTERQTAKAKSSHKMSFAEKKAKAELIAKEKAELELLLLNDTQVPPQNHFDAKEILRHEKAKTTAQKRKLLRKGKEGEGLQDDFELNVEDERFDTLFASHHFAIDPTHPAFKKTKVMDQMLNEKRKRRVIGKENEDRAGSSGFSTTTSTVASNGMSSNTSTTASNGVSSLMSLVEAVKQKTNAFQNKNKSKKQF